VMHERVYSISASALGVHEAVNRMTFYSAVFKSYTSCALVSFVPISVSSMIGALLFLDTPQTTSGISRKLE